MTIPPLSNMQIFEKDHITIGYIEINNISPLIVHVSINNTDLRVKLQNSITGTRYNVSFPPNLVDEIYLPPRISEDIFETCDEIKYLFENDEIEMAICVADYMYGVYTTYLNREIRQNSRKGYATRFLEKLVDITREWEIRNDFLIHKGSPYYFLTSFYLSVRDIDSAFASMFKAIEEDKRSKPLITGNADDYKDAPAYKYASLIDDDGNYLYESVVKIRTFLSNILSDHNNNATTLVSISDIDAKFLNNDDFEELKFVFVYNLEKYIKYVEQFKEFKLTNQFYELVNSNNIFDLCLLIDKILEKKYTTMYNHQFPGQRIYFGGLVWCLFQEKGWISGIQHAGVLKRQLSPQVLDMDPRNALSNLESNDVLLNDSPINYEMRLMLLVWKLRNYGAHTIKREQSFVEDYEKYMKWVLGALFTSIECL